MAGAPHRPRDASLPDRGRRVLRTAQVPSDRAGPSQWLRALAEETGAALRADLSADADGWQQLWALLRGLALTVPPGDAESDTDRLARERFPDIKDPYETTIAEAGLVAKLLADRGLASGAATRPTAPAAGEPLVACDAYGSRFLLAAPFRYDGDGATRRRITGMRGTSTSAGSTRS